MYNKNHNSILPETFKGLGTNDKCWVQATSILHFIINIGETHKITEFPFYFHVCMRICMLVLLFRLDFESQWKTQIL